MSGLPREVLRWVQSLDLTWQVKVPKWDFHNGYLIAEIFSWYFPHDVRIYSFQNGNSVKVKMENWYILKEFIRAKHLDIPEEYINGTIHCKEGAAALLVECMYEMLTNRKVKKVPKEMEGEFTDFAYQVTLPLHARSTAAKAIKNNLRLTEVLHNPNLVFAEQKCEKIIKDHIDHRRMERIQDPHRFNIKPTLGERCMRKSPPPPHSSTETTMDQKESDSSINQPASKELLDISLPVAQERERSVHFKEIQVKQTDKDAFFTIPIPGC